MQLAATARTADRKRTVHTLAMISIGRMRVMNKQKKDEGKRVLAELPVVSEGPEAELQEWEAGKQVEGCSTG